MVVALTLLGLVVAVLGLTYAVRTFNGRSAANFKRLHFVSHSQPLTYLWGLQDAAPRVRFKFTTRDLLIPHVTLLRIENTGRAPILAEDFQGDLTIAFGDLAQVLMAHVQFNRDDVIDPEVHRIEQRKGLLKLSPLLLNPGDCITFSFLMEGLPQNVGVRARIAGVNEVATLPAPIEDKYVRTSVEVTSLVFGRTIDWRRNAYFDCNVHLMPVLVDPSKQLTSDLYVAMGEHTASTGYIVCVTFEVADEADVSGFSAGRENLKFSTGSALVCGGRLRAGDYLYADSTVQKSLSWSRHGFSIKSSLLRQLPKEFQAEFLVEGEPELSVVNKPAWLTNVLKFRHVEHVTADDLLASTRPRLLLSNRRLYNAWHRTSDRFSSWLRSTGSKAKKARLDFSNWLELERRRQENSRKLE